MTAIQSTGLNEQIWIQLKGPFVAKSHFWKFVQNVHIRPAGQREWRDVGVVWKDEKKKQKEKEKVVRIEDSEREKEGRKRRKVSRGTWGKQNFFFQQKRVKM